MYLVALNKRTYYIANSKWANVTQTMTSCRTLCIMVTTCKTRIDIYTQKILSIYTYLNKTCYCKIINLWASSNSRKGKKSH